MRTIHAAPPQASECISCGGAGLYVGRLEEPGTALICFDCKGIGAVQYGRKLFTRRNYLGGITRIFMSQARGLKIVKVEGSAMSYPQFEERYPVGPMAKA